MNEINQIKQTAQREAKANPKLAEQILDAARLALSEIADGESPHHELELFEDQIKELKESP